MAETQTDNAPKKRKASAKKTAAKKTTSAKTPRKGTATKGAAKETASMTDNAKTADNRTEAKSRFNAALEEAKAGAAALKVALGGCR